VPAAAVTDLDHPTDVTDPPSESPNSRSHDFGRRLVALLAVAVGACYLSWRLLTTAAWPVWWLAGPLIALELYAFAAFLLFTLTAWDVDGARPAAPVETPPGRVAALIATYNEPIEVLLPTVAAAVAMRVEHETWVLDDGARPWVRELATGLGARYLARADRTHAKAGNINAALDRIGAEFVAVFDADHVPTADFLAHTLGYFADPKLALVQTPQEFYNRDSFEHTPRRGLLRRRRSRTPYCEQNLFYRVLQLGRNRWNAAFWCGTNAVLRTSALRDVGGVATDSVTEDIHTTIRLHRHGWRTVYHGEVLARGLAAADAAQYLTQRVRWGTGAMQVLRRENPIFGPNLTLAQRLSYAATLLGWFDVWRSLGMMLVPALVIATGVSPVRAPALPFLVGFGVSLVTQQVALLALGRGHGSVWQSLVFECIRMPAGIVATLALLTNRDAPFRVTPKGRQGDARRRARVPGLLVALLVVLVAALVWYAADLFLGGPLHYGRPWAAAAAAGWLTFDVALVAAALHRVSSPRFASERRAAVRLPAPGSASFAGHRARLVDVSSTGAQVAVPASVVVEGATWLQFRLPDGIAELDVIVRSTRLVDGELHYAMEFVPGQLADQALLARSLVHGEWTTTAAARPLHPAIVPTPRAAGEQEEEVVAA
jgi:cellulose synthase (UDP-forming)